MAFAGGRREVIEALELAVAQFDAVAAVFSSTRATRRVPGIGAKSWPWASSQASAICAGVAPASAAMARTWSTMARLRRKFSPVKRGLVLRQSSSGIS